MVAFAAVVDFDSVLFGVLESSGILTLEHFASRIEFQQFVSLEYKAYSFDEDNIFFVFLFSVSGTKTTSAKFQDMLLGEIYILVAVS